MEKGTQIMNGPFCLGLILLSEGGNCSAALWRVDALWGAKLRRTFNANRIIYKVTDLMLRHRIPFSPPPAPAGHFGYAFPA